MRRSSLQLLRPLAAAIALAASVFASGCVDDGGDCNANVQVEVQPRVALTGGIELSDRSAGRVVIDEVVAHAPVALLEHATGATDVVDDHDPLLFRYLLADRSGFGAAIGGGRLWTLPRDGANLAVAFEPAPRSLAMRVGDDIDSEVVAGLAGHTLVVHGTIAVQSDDEGFGVATGFADDVDPDGGAADGTDGNLAGDVDPDGGAADGTDTSDVDPDGGAADGTPDTGDVDPDGGAAQPTPADVDPDGGAAQPTPADVDPDGGAAGQKPGAKDVDPDGGAAEGELGDGHAREQGLPKSAPRRDVRRGIVMVPFTVVVDGSFALSVHIDADALGTVGAGEILPIDLELSASRLLDRDRLALLEAVAADAVRDDAVEPVQLQLSGSAGATSVAVNGGVRKPKVVASETSRVKVTAGGTRR